MNELKKQMAQPEVDVGVAPARGEELRQAVARLGEHAMRPCATMAEMQEGMAMLAGLVGAGLNAVDGELDMPRYQPEPPPWHEVQFAPRA
eukprot:2893062-Lingulodinium_polyedra.AAC.1